MTPIPANNIVPFNTPKPATPSGLGVQIPLPPPGGQAALGGGIIKPGSPVKLSPTPAPVNPTIVIPKAGGGYQFAPNPAYKPPAPAIPGAAGGLGAGIGAIGVIGALIGAIGGLLLFAPPAAVGTIPKNLQKPQPAKPGTPASFTGGQCQGIAYAVTFKFTSNNGGDQAAIYQLQGAIGELFLKEKAPGYGNYWYLPTGKGTSSFGIREMFPEYDNGVPVLPKIIDISKLDGTPDNCGNPPPKGYSPPLTAPTTPGTPSVPPGTPSAPPGVGNLPPNVNPPTLNPKQSNPQAPPIIPPWVILAPPGQPITITPPNAPPYTFTAPPGGQPITFTTPGAGAITITPPGGQPITIDPVTGQPTTPGQTTAPSNTTTPGSSTATTSKTPPTPLIPPPPFIPAIGKAPAPNLNTQLPPAAASAGCQTGTCSGNISSQVNANGQGIGNNLAATNYWGGMNYTLGAQQAAKLDGLAAGQTEILNRLGAQLPGGGISGFLGTMANGLSKFYKWSGIDRIFNILTFLSVVHNAYQLSSSLKVTLLEMVANVGNAIGIPGVTETAEGDAFDLNSYFNKEVETIFKIFLGVSTVENIKDSWKKYNRIYSAAAQSVDAFSNMLSSIGQVVETTAEYTGKIGNSLKAAGVLFERSQEWFAEKFDARKSKFFTRYSTSVAGTIEFVELINEIAESVVEGQEAAVEFQQANTEFVKAVKDSGKAEVKENATNKAVADTAKTASQTVTIDDLALIEKE